MDRIEAIREYLKPYISNRIQEKAKMADGEKNDSLIDAVTVLMNNAIKRKKMYPVWKPSYVGLFHLMTSLVTESYEYELMIADEQLYLDEFQVTNHWRPDFLYQEMQEGEYIKKELEKRFVRLNSYEISYAKKFVFYEYRNITGVYWRKQIEEIKNLEEFLQMKTSVPFQFLFGDYMGEIHTISDYGEVQQDG